MWTFQITDYYGVGVSDTNNIYFPRRFLCSMLPNTYVYIYIYLYIFENKTTETFTSCPVSVFPDQIKLGHMIGVAQIESWGEGGGGGLEIFSYDRTVVGSAPRCFPVK